MKTPESRNAITRMIAKFLEVIRIPRNSDIKWEYRASAVNPSKFGYYPVMTVEQNNLVKDVHKWVFGASSMNKKRSSQYYKLGLKDVEPEVVLDLILKIHKLNNISHTGTSLMSYWCEFLDSELFLHDYYSGELAWKVMM